MLDGLIENSEDRMLSDESARVAINIFSILIFFCYGGRRSY